MDFKRLIIKLLLLFTPFFLIIEGAFYVDILKEKDIKIDYIASIIDKQLLLKNTKSPKIIIIGGSGSAYGICSDSIEKHTGIRTINQAIIFTFGPQFMMNQIEPYLNKGDVVVFSPEYMMVNYGDYTDQLKAARFFPEIKKHVEFKNFRSQLSEELRFRINYFKFFLGSFRTNDEAIASVDDTTSVFFRNASDKNGNLISHLNNSKTEVVPIVFQMPDKYFEVLEYLNTINKKFEQKGIKLLFSHPTFCSEMTEEDIKNIKKVEIFMKQKANFTIIDSTKTSQFDKSFYFDQVYHLNAKGRAVRSKTLAVNIKKALNIP